MMVLPFIKNLLLSSKSLRDQSGAALVYTAIALIPLLGVVAFGIDALNLQTIKQDLQDSVDSAALGASYRLKQIGAASGSVNIASVETLAESLLNANVAKKISTSKAGILTGNVAQVSTSGYTKTLELVASYKSETMLMWILGNDSVTVTTKAKAQYSVEPQPRFYIILADRSSSMEDKIPKTNQGGSGGVKKINVLKSTLKSIIDIFPQEWGMALIAFGNGATIKKNMSLNINKSQYKQAVTSLTPDGGTNFITAFSKASTGTSNPIDRAIALGMPSNGDGLHILLITDGNPHSMPEWIDKSWLLNKFKTTDPAYATYQKYFPGCSSVNSADDYVTNDPRARFLESVKQADMIREAYPKAVVDALVIGNKGEPVKASDYTCTGSHLSGCKNKFPFEDFFQAVSGNENIMDAKDKLAWPYLLSRITLAKNNETVSVQNKFKEDFPPPLDPMSGTPGFTFPDAPCMRTYESLRAASHIAGRLYLSQTADDVKDDIKEYFKDQTEKLELIE